MIWPLSDTGRRVGRMPRTPRRCRCARSSAAVNEQIRALVDRPGEWPAEEYEQLLEQWAATVRGKYQRAA